MTARALNIGIILATLFAFTGCKSILKGERPLVVRAEQIAAIATESLDALFRLDYQHAEWIDANHPGIKDKVNSLRRKAPGMLEGLREATQDYKAIESPTTEDKLNAALDLVLKLRDEATRTTRLIEQKRGEHG